MFVASKEIPTEDDWRSEEWSLEAETAYENLYGKSIEEAVKLFEDNSLRYQEDVKYMPSRVFGFYLKAYMTYLMSGAARGDSDGASCFIEIIVFKAEYRREDLVPLWPEIEPVLRRLAEHQDDYQALWEIYGSFRGEIHKIVEMGFETSFDTSIPEVVPEGMTLENCFRQDLSMPVALQLLENSGFRGLGTNPTKSDALRVFGPPDASGGGEHPQFGFFPYWINYNRQDRMIRFVVYGDTVRDVWIM